MQLSYTWGPVSLHKLSSLVQVEVSSSFTSLGPTWAYLHQAFAFSGRGYDGESDHDARLPLAVWLPPASLP